MILQSPPAPSPAPPGRFRRYLGTVEAWDHACLRYFHGLRLGPRALRSLRIFVRIGDGWIWGAVATYLFVAKSRPEAWSIVAHSLMAVGVSLALYWPIKLLVRRSRPFQIEGLGVTARVPPLDKYSFPSGHTMNNLAVALTLAFYLPAWFYLMLVVPVLWGALRILFGVHFLSDIVAGALLGFGSFWLAKALFAHFGAVFPM